jgi:protein tyrosine/serine phosphatase
MTNTCNVPNFYKINDNIYRSAQPTEEGMKQLCDVIGIRTVINLRSFHSDNYKKICSKALNDERVHAKAWDPEDEDVIKVMKILSHQENGPFLIHCQAGADRTGLMSAMYRILCQGWPKEEAIYEMVNGGYGFHPWWRGTVGKYIEDLTEEKIKGLQDQCQCREK